MSGEQPPTTPKIIIDSDWKSQAQAEKEKLAAGNKPKPAAAPAPTSAAGASQPPQAGDIAAGQADAPEEADLENRPVGFQDLVSLLVTQALMYLGAMPDPQTGRAVVAPEYAKLHIDMLAVLEEKTKGNLNEKESQLLSRAVQELRLEFVEVAKAIQKAVAEGKLKPGAMGGMGGMGGGPGIVTAPPGMDASLDPGSLKFKL